MMIYADEYIYTQRDTSFTELTQLLYFQRWHDISSTIVLIGNLGNLLYSEIYQDI